MNYLKVEDKSEVGSTVLIYLEVNKENEEIRKIEIVNGGLLGYANKEFAFNGTTLAKEPLLSISEINSLSGFIVTIITRAEFEDLWQQIIMIS